MSDGTSECMEGKNIKQTIQKVGQSMAPLEAQPSSVRIELRPSLVGYTYPLSILARCAWASVATRYPRA